MRFLLRTIVAACAVSIGYDAWAFETPNAVAISSVREFLADPLLVSAEGRDFELIRAVSPASRVALRGTVDRFLVQGGLHGNEGMTTEFVRWLARRYARGESLLNLFPYDQVEIDFLPVANPDGSLARDRYNAKNVNLNRNFGVLWGISRENPGTSRFSEPETRAIEALFRARAYLAAVDVHGFIDWVVSPSKPEELRRLGAGRKHSEAQEKAYFQWYGYLEQELENMPSYSLKTAASLGDGGAFEDWAFWDRGTFAFCLEMESFQRYAIGENPGVTPLASHGDGASLDLFRRYEAFIFRMFQHARQLRGVGE